MKTFYFSDVTITDWRLIYMRRLSCKNSQSHDFKTKQSCWTFHTKHFSLSFWNSQKSSLKIISSSRKTNSLESEGDKTTIDIHSFRFGLVCWRISSDFKDMLAKSKPKPILRTQQFSESYKFRIDFINIEDLKDFSSFKHKTKEKWNLRVLNHFMTDIYASDSITLIAWYAYLEMRSS